MSFTARLVAGTCFVLFLAVIILVWTAEGTLRQSLEDDISRALEREAALVAEALPADAAQWGPALRRLSERNGHGITLAERSGRVVAASGPDQAARSVAGARDVVASLASGRPAVLAERALPVPLLHVSVPGGPGVIRLTARLDEINRTANAARSAAIGAAALALLVGTALAWIAAQSVAQPLVGLATAANAIAAGALPRFPRSGIAEIDALVQALRQMHRQLQDRFDELRREQGDAAVLVESMVEGVVGADRRGTIVTANAAARRLLGYGAGDPMPELRQLFRAKAARDVVDAVLAGETVVNRELEFGERTLVLNARPLGAGGAMLVLHDLTEVRRLEAIRRDFVANVSHELKTPLTSISGYSETLLGDEPDPATTRRFLETILKNARRMQRLVDDLLDLSRIEAGRWQPQPVDLAVGEVAQEAWETLAERAAQRGVAFELQLDPTVTRLRFDADALRQILLNLFDNAIRYTPAGGRITCRTHRVDAGRVELAVQDTGSGIPGDHLGRIFERFYRADPSRSRDEGGTGLGLAIVKHLVEAHEGTVTADSLLGSGTTISLVLPG